MAAGNPNSDLDLMLHVDGELDEAADRDVELRIGRDLDARAKVDALVEVGELMRGHLELTTDAVPARRFDQMWREIDKQIDLAAAATAPVPERAASESVMTVLPAQASLWRRVTHWLDRKRGYVITAMVSAGAVAAIALVARPGGTGLDATSLETAVAHRPAELEALDTPGGTWTMMNVADEDGDATVIWVTPEDSVEGL